MLGEALKQLRLFYGVKQKDLADSINLSSSYISEIEKGKKKNIPIEIINKYAEFFQIDSSYIILFSEGLAEDSPKLRVNKKAARKILRIMNWISEKREFQDEPNT